MPDDIHLLVPRAEAAADGGALDLLGGRKLARRLPRSPVEIHAFVASGLPSRSLVDLARGFTVIDGREWVEKATGISPRTFARLKAAPSRRMAADQSDRVWRTARVLGRAIAAFGARKAAEEWLDRPARALGGRRPLDLMSTSAGLELVSDALGRIEYGVYT